MPTTPGDLVLLFSERYTLIRTEAAEVYAVPLTGPQLAVPLDSLGPTLAVERMSQTGDVPGETTVRAALSVLSTLVRETRPVFIRMAHYDDLSYLDLGTPDGRYVEIGPSGWRVRDPAEQRCPVVFTRPSGTLALPDPMRDPDVTRDDLARLLGLPISDTRWRVLWGWLVAQVRPDTARPMPYLLGSQGSGKTTRGLLVANMLQPSEVLGEVLKKTARENNPLAKNTFLLTSDNMTRMSEDVSNWLCSLVTGVKVEERKLYTNAETVSYVLRRSGLFTGKVLPQGIEADAQERLLVVEFERVPTDQVRGDDEIMADFRTVHGRLLAALLNDMAGVLARLPTTMARDAAGYRFVLYGRMHAALDRIAGPGWVDAVVSTSERPLVERVYDLPDLVAVFKTVAENGGDWDGTATDLLADMNRWRGNGPSRDAYWPATPAALSTRLRNQQHALALAGLHLEFRLGTDRNKTRIIHAEMSTEDVARWVRPPSIADIELTLSGGKS